MTILAIICSFIGVWLLNEQGSLTSKRAQALVAYGIILAGAVLCCIDYGTLRGVFIYIAIVSLIGTLLPLAIKSKVKN